MICNLPKITSPPPGWCCPPAAGIKQTHDVCRTLARPVANTSDEDVLQDEAGLAVLDEVTARFIYDDMKTGNSFA